MPELWELGGVDDGSGELKMLTIAHEGMREGATTVMMSYGPSIFSFR